MIRAPFLKSFGRCSIARFLLSGALPLTAVFITLPACSEEKPAGVDVRIDNGPTVHAEVVSTPGARQLGLMYRKELAENAGMLFVFPEEKPLTFWMKNTYVPLDIIFLDRDLRVVSVAENAVPMTETPRPSNKPAQYALEVRAGSAVKWHLTAGMALHLDGTLPAPQ